MTGTPARNLVRLIQGEYRVSSEPEVVMSTILGSCVAACLRDPYAGVGGMNHFLLPGNSNRAGNDEAERYGVHLMELLVNGLLKRGAQRQRLQAKLFGGARMVEGLSDVGAMNAQFAKHFLEIEGIELIGGSLGGSRGRRVEFKPASGDARQIFFHGVEAPVVDLKPVPKAAATGIVEFF